MGRRVLRGAFKAHMQPRSDTSDTLPPQGPSYWSDSKHTFQYNSPHGNPIPNPSKAALCKNRSSTSLIESCIGFRRFVERGCQAHYIVCCSFCFATIFTFCLTHNQSDTSLRSHPIAQLLSLSTIQTFKQIVNMLTGSSDELESAMKELVHQEVQRKTNNEVMNRLEKLEKAITTASETQETNFKLTSLQLTMANVPLGAFQYYGKYQTACNSSVLIVSILKVFLKDSGHELPNGTMTDLIPPTIDTIQRFHNAVVDEIFGLTGCKPRIEGGPGGKYFIYRGE
ncbi:uncharacterized protein EV422DRAFT_179178 [Fimicolochytrium jonesii]|uniref:uncharacterized protein n=1 Tax=Fimicolochytrium jonesii TaxID=1396493 RepID=UPI0022FE3128|nr:uncharacterized protein EV422DRAFT_179178 [Fimicolochytrium jonesii]KAI8818312.1 hypothetical protein EV422DRAFT_179178 [Fimicolochytrium jonesii]